MIAIRSIIAIGASAGGLKAITATMANMPLHPDIAVFVVLHMASSSTPQIVVEHIQRVTDYQCCLPEDGEPISGGRLYIARPDYHMIVKNGIIRIIKGAHENRWRPSIDVLFRSAAVAYTSHVTGVILTGLLDDGTAGMHAIKRCGGICIVQEPDEAEFPDMPSSVLGHVDVDYRVPVADIGYIIGDLYTKPARPAPTVPEEIKTEAAMAERMVTKIENFEKIGTRSNYTCPDCGGSLWSVKNDPVHRYRCFTGHAYTERLLDEKKIEQLEDALWVSIRLMEERENLLETTAIHQQLLDNPAAEHEKRSEANKLRAHIEQLKHLAITLGGEAKPDQGFVNDFK